MLYRVIKSTVAQGRMATVGDVLDLSASEGKELMAYGKVVPHKEEINREEIVIETQEAPAYETRVVKRGRPPKGR